MNEVTIELFETYNVPEDYANATENELAGVIYGITFLDILPALKGEVLAL